LYLSFNALLKQQLVTASTSSALPLEPQLAAKETPARETPAKEKPVKENAPRESSQSSQGIYWFLPFF
jgi:hypothetical protein